MTVILAVTLITACSKETKKARLLGEADNYFKAGNYDKAKLGYLNVLRMDSGNALAFERIGAMWQDDGAPLRAAGFLKRASELDPKNVQNRIRLARCYVATGRFADGTREALKVLEQAPNNSDAILALAEAARSKEDIEAAWEQLEKFPNKNDVSFHLALANGSFTKATSLQRQPRLPGRLSQPIQSRLLRIWQWETCIWPRKTKKSHRRIQDGGRSCAYSISRKI